MIRAAPGLYPVREILPPDTSAAFLVLSGPYGFADGELADGEALFVDRVDRVMRPGGYRLAGTFEPGSAIAAGVAGFRLIRSNALGDHFWIDDFVTSGIGVYVETAQLLSFLIREAGHLGITQLHLDVLSDQMPDTSDGDSAAGSAAVYDFENPPQRSEPVMNREQAVAHGFRELGGRFVLLTGSDNSSKPQDQAPASMRRRQLGRPRRPRR